MPVGSALESEYIYQIARIAFHWAIKAQAVYDND